MFFPKVTAVSLALSMMGTSLPVTASAVSVMIASSSEDIQTEWGAHLTCSLNSAADHQRCRRDV